MATVICPEKGIAHLELSFEDRIIQSQIEEVIGYPGWSINWNIFTDSDKQRKIMTYSTRSTGAMNHIATKIVGSDVYGKSILFSPDETEDQLKRH